MKTSQAMLWAFVFGALAALGGVMLSERPAPKVSVTVMPTPAHTPKLPAVIYGTPPGD